MIQVQSLVKHFQDAARGQVLAVNQLSFQVAAGEVYGLLGPNGAGKTTTLRIISTLTQPDGGTVHVAGANVVTDPLGARRSMAYVPAESGLPERLTPIEVVELFAAIQGMRSPHELALKMLEQLGAGSYLHTPCGELSTGMKRRVALARALVHEPKVLLLDEPTDGLDVQGRRDALDLIREQAALGRAVVISSHIMSEVQRVASRIGVMARGRMVAEGSIENILAAADRDSLEEAFVKLTE